MKRPLQRLLTIVVAAAVGSVAAISAQALTEDRMSTSALVAAAGVAVPTAARADVTPAHPEKPAGIVSYRDAVAHAVASVVTVHSAHALKGALPFAPKVIAKGLASGVIVDRDGYIVTNYHVIEEASQLAVARANGTMYLAQVVGTDPASDLALLKIDADDLQPIVFADIDDVEVGDVVLAVGNPFGIGQTVTQGIVSAIVRRGTEPIDNFVQTDAAINPGNSGGALIDTAGRLIGINTVILSNSGGSQGIGFAIPGDLVQTVVATLKMKGRVARSWLGMSTAMRTHGDGALVVGVERDGPAECAGIAPGDIVVRVGGKPVHHAQDVNNIVIGNEPGTHMPMDIVRGGTRASVDVRLAPVPDGETK
jgi:S1-C subfamily serine protease